MLKVTKVSIWTCDYKDGVNSDNWVNGKQSFININYIISVDIRHLTDGKTVYLIKMLDDEPFYIKENILEELSEKK